MSAKDLILHLEGDRIDLAAPTGRGGGLRRLARLPLEPSTDVGGWIRSLRRAAPALRAVLMEQGLPGSTATVYYRTASQWVGTIDVPVASAIQAESAARLAAPEHLNYASDSAVIAAASVARDATGSPRRRHVIVTADREEIVAALVELVREAGLRPETIVPIDGPAAAALVRRAMTMSGEMVGLLYVGDHASAFAVASEGTLRFTRRIDLGLAALTAALRRPIRTGGQSEPITLDETDARRILARHGIPKYDEVVLESPRLTGAQVIPAIQPALQRFIVELRQSLRFGLEAEERERVSIRVVGPGAKLPGLEAMLRAEAEVAVEVIETGEAGIEDESSCGGELALAWSERAIGRALGLLPVVEAESRRTNRLRAALWTGAVAAGVLLAGETVRLERTIEEREAQVAAIMTGVNDLEALRATTERLGAAVAAVNELDASVASDHGNSAPLHACMHELSLLCPATVRFTSIDLRRRDEETLGTIAGYAFEAKGSDDPTDPLAELVENLSGSPLVRDVRLGRIQIGAFGDRNGRRFEATFTVVPAPPDRRLAMESSS